MPDEQLIEAACAAFAAAMGKEWEYVRPKDRPAIRAGVKAVIDLAKPTIERRAVERIRDALLDAKKWSACAHVIARFP